MSDADCEKCEELLQGYLDRDLTPAEVKVAEGISAAVTTAAGATTSRRTSAASSARAPASACPPGCSRSWPSSAARPPRPLALARPAVRADDDDEPVRVRATGERARDEAELARESDRDEASAG